VDDRVRAFGNDPNANNAQPVLPIAALYKNTLRNKQGRNPAEELLFQNLEDGAKHAGAHGAAAQAFFQKCGERLNGAEKEQAVRDIMTWASHQRSVMRAVVVGKNQQRLLEPSFPIRVRDQKTNRDVDLEIDNKMVMDNLSDPINLGNPNAFDPTNCRLELPPNQVK
jgi:hypothetical protein